MAGLITEALARDEEVTWKKSLATERAAMLEALEKLKPNLAALIDAPAVKASGPKAGPPATAASTSTFDCRKCGHTLVGEEQFCGNCGTPRSSDYEPPGMQSKVAIALADAGNNEKDYASGSCEYWRRIRKNQAATLAARRKRKNRRLPIRSKSRCLSFLQPPELPIENQTAAPESRAPISAEFEDSVLSDLEIPRRLARTRGKRKRRRRFR